MIKRRTGPKHAEIPQSSKFGYYPTQPLKPKVKYKKAVKESNGFQLGKYAESLKTSMFKRW